METLLGSLAWWIERWRKPCTQLIFLLLFLHTVKLAGQPSTKLDPAHFAAHHAVSTRSLEQPHEEHSFSALLRNAAHAPDSFRLAPPAARAARVAPKPVKVSKNLFWRCSRAEDLHHAAPIDVIESASDLGVLPISSKISNALINPARLKSTSMRSGCEYGYSQNCGAAQGDNWKLSSEVARGDEQGGNEPCAEEPSMHSTCSRNLFRLALSEHYAGRLAAAIALYNKVILLGQKSDAREEKGFNWTALAMQNLGAAFQRQGRFREALGVYQSVLKSNLLAPSTLSNVGATLLSLNKIPQAIGYLNAALALDSELLEAHVNLCSAFAKLGATARARKHMDRAIQLSAKGKNCGFLVRRATLMRPVMQSRENIKRDRALVAEALNTLEKQQGEGEDSQQCMRLPVEEYEHLHFYLAYHGENEYSNQQRIFRLLQGYGGTALRYAASTKIKGKNISVPTRVGFISRFWQEDHPHGLLVEGVLTGLKETSSFIPFVLALPNVAGRPAEYIVEAVGGSQYVFELSGSLRDIRQAIAELELDVLVFVDTMSEPTTYFLTFARLAPTQVAFWGNPLTSGSSEVDYFISSDWMEQDFAGKGTETIKPHYTEQLLRLANHGIWYDLSRFQLPETISSPLEFWTKFDRSANGLDLLRRRFRSQWTRESETTSGISQGPVYIAAQSVFKIHPAFDLALKAILTRVRDAHLVLLQGRQHAWTEMLQRRLYLVMPEVFRSGRIHFTPRRSTPNEYFELLASADVVLQPFPFGGSKTAADAIALGLPLVAMQGAFLRGRMAAALLRRIGCGVDGRPYDKERCVRGWTRVNTVARNHTEYVEIAVQLGRASHLRANVSATVMSQRHKIFREDNVVSGWISFFKRLRIGSKMSKESRGRLGLLRRHIETATNDFHVREHLLRGLLRLNNSDPFVHNDLGVALRWQNKISSAINHFRKATEFHPKFAEGYNNLGVALQASRDYFHAERAYMKAIALAPNWEHPLFNLGNCYRDQRRFDEQELLYRRIFRLHGLTGDRTVTLVYLATFRRSELSRIKSSSLQSAIRKIQGRRFPRVLDSFLKLLVDQLPRPLDFHRIAHQSMPLAQLSVKCEKPSECHVEEKVEIITQFFLAEMKSGESDSSDRGAEIRHALLRNLNNPSVSRVHLLTERHFSWKDLGISLPELKAKVEQTVIGHRLQVLDAFRYAEQRLGGRLCALLNADIYVDQRVGRSRFLLEHYTEGAANAVLALLRWEEHRLMQFRPRADAQGAYIHTSHFSRLTNVDGWIFRAPLAIGPTEEHEYAFDLGRLRSDNRIAFLLSRRHVVVNSALDVRLYHVHKSPKRAYSVLDSIQGEGSYVPFSAPLFVD